MDTSIPGPSISISHSSHTSLKRSRNSRSQNVGGEKPPRKRKKGNDERLDSNDNDIYGDDSYNNRLSAATRDTVLKLRKIKDPFDQDLQKIVDDVFVHFDQQPRDNVDLAESALLLSSVTQVYSTQVKTLHEEVLAIAARLTGRERSPQKGRKKKIVDIENSENPESNNQPNNLEENNGNDAKNVDNKSSQQVDDSTTPVDDGSKGESTEAVECTSKVGEGDNDGANDPSLPSADEGVNQNGMEKPSEVGEVVVKVEPPEQDTVEGELEEPSVEELQILESEILNEIPSRCTRRQSERIKNILNIEKAKERDYKLKKRKFDDDPPELISCYDEWNQILALAEEQGDIDFDSIFPPVLEVQVGRKRKKLTINNNEIVGEGDDDCEACHLAGSEEVNRDAPEEELGSPFKLPLQVDFDRQQYETLDHLPSDVQESFHALVQEMHKLPFDYGLMQQDMFKVYQQKFLQAVSLLSQNSVLVKRTDEEKEGPSNVLDLNNSQLSETDQTLSSIGELLSQVRQQAAEEYNKGKQSKSDAEIPISQMIATLKRIICSRYKKWHVRTDSDKAVFKRIKEFEDRVKAVLRREAEQGLFDVKKYEMEVMDVTLKESQDNDNEEYTCPASPLLTLSDTAESPIPEDLKNWSMNALSLSRRSSIAGSIDGSSSWIRLYDIFSHMKKIDNSETCRHFYAVLALLSHQNLSINYDTLFSQESAKLITKLLKKQHGNMEKYPVGAKIMNSRCPDVDRDEILLAPVLSAAFRQALEQDGYLSSSGYQSDSQASTGTSLSFAQPTKSIQDAISEFVIDPGEPLEVEDLFTSRRYKKQQNPSTCQK